jgi:hypothetical protein
MQTQSKYNFSDTTLDFRVSNNMTINVQPLDMKIISNGERNDQLILNLSVDSKIYQQIDHEELFNLSLDVRKNISEDKFSPEKPIEIEIRPDRDLFIELLEQGETAEEIGNYLLRSNDIDGGNLLWTNRWYALYVKQTIQLPLELEKIGDLKVGYSTIWTDENIFQDSTGAHMGNAILSKENEAENLSSSEKTILDVITAYFSKDGEPVYKWENETTISFPYRSEQAKWHCYVSGRDESSLCCFYSVCAELVPEEKRLSVAEFLTRINYMLTVGNFEMDFSDGEVRYRTSVDVEGDHLSNALLKQLTMANVTMMDQHLPGILAIINDNVLPIDAVTMVQN